MATKQMNVARAATAAVVLVLVGHQAVAADFSEPCDPDEGPLVTEWPSPWQIRLRALGVITEDSGFVNRVPGSGLSYSNTVTPELDISYFFTDNVEGSARAALNAPALWRLSGECRVFPACPGWADDYGNMRGERAQV